MRLKNLLLCALFAALTAASVFLPKIPIPGTPLMFTFQTFFVFLTGLMLEPRFALISQLVYMALGLIGLPVFMNGGGLSYVLEPSSALSSALRYAPFYQPARAQTGDRVAEGRGARQALAALRKPRWAQCLRCLQCT